MFRIQAVARGAVVIQIAERSDSRLNELQLSVRRESLILEWIFL